MTVAPIHTVAAKHTVATHAEQPATRLTPTALHSRLRWLSRLANHAVDLNRLVELDCRCHLLIRTILRQAREAA